MPVPRKKKSLLAAFLVAGAALLWATDTLVRYPSTVELDFKLVVLMEHLVGLALITPFVLVKRRPEISKLFRPRVVLLLLVVGVGGSALGGLAFTYSMRTIGPDRATVFQMVQPLFVLVFARMFLREKHSSSFVLIALWAVMNAFLIGFPGLLGQMMGEELGFSGPGILSGAMAVVLWGFSTVAGKALLFRHRPEVVVFGRWLMASGFMLGWFFLSGESVPWGVLASREVWLSSLYLGSVAGVGGMTLYYYGLRKLPASLVTFIELLYPLAGVFVPIFFFGGKTTNIQAFSGIFFLFSIGLLVKLEFGESQSEALST
ncbi:DMT family transporter [Bdellovibrionota bacterium FG-2]